MPSTRTPTSSRAHKKPAEIKFEPPNEPVTDAWISGELKGDCPQLTDRHESVQDPRTGKIYHYGGLPPGDKHNVPKPYFYVCDTENMWFTDLTNSLMYAPPGDPCAERENKPLPSLSRPGITLLEINECSLIFLFGGHDAGEANEPSSALIAIHPEQKEWWYIGFENDGSPRPAPRINSVLVGVNRKLYIFGGITQFGRNWTHHRTYSIIEFQEGPHKWKWVVVDKPYPDNVPPGQVFGDGLPIYNGILILLMPGRETRESKINFCKDNFFYFLTINNSFVKANPSGVLPTDVHWYEACNFDLSSTNGPSSSSEPDSPSILMCTWIPHGAKDLTPEVWRYFVHPKNKVVCLGIGQRIYDLEKDFRRFSLIGSRMFLLGRDGNKAMCDTYVEIPVQSLS